MVVNLHDAITFAGESVAELRRAFQESVDDYLAFYAARNEPPEKPYSGTLTARRHGVCDCPYHGDAYSGGRLRGIL